MFSIVYITQHPPPLIQHYHQPPHHLHSTFMYTIKYSMVLSETSPDFTLLSGWRERRTVSRTSTLTSAVSVLGWPSCCFTWYSGERINVKILMMVMSKTHRSTRGQRRTQESRSSRSRPCRRTSSSPTPPRSHLRVVVKIMKMEISLMMMISPTTLSM